MSDTAIAPTMRGIDRVLEWIDAERIIVVHPSLAAVWRVTAGMHQDAPMRRILTREAACRRSFGAVGR